ncbi:CsgG/HfaB family protein [Cesiribacter sp. SM1]|uniref:CsgG/HfaB family protein n=1 Tax=Cesiribacter sp. SM1 TaxID=2861196 RepID=UPI001CD63AE6|nr:CsgG/HfaB family protein [Cesiribacter sp. SM1]
MRVLPFFISQRFSRGLTASLLLLLLLPACAPYLSQPLKTSAATLGVPAPGSEGIVNLPPPQQKIVAAVYKFRDQTGQYKPSVTGTNWSTAVTQGATSILINSLNESGWFTPIERENLGNLLNERKIIRSTRAEAQAITGKEQPALPALLFAGVILEGGIISYDANIVTGGAGLRYFAAGGSGQYREDKITVYLRAVSSSTGEILKTVYTSKTILSQSVDFGLFRYVKFKRLLEVETGFTYNEPTEMAVKEAINKAVQSLIIEGLLDGYWKLENSTDMESPVIREYLQEKEDVQNTNVHGHLLADRRSKTAVSVAAGGILYRGDYANPVVRPMGELGLKLSASDHLAFDVKFGRGALATNEIFSLTVNYAELDLNYNLFPKTRHTPYLQLGGGTLVPDNIFSDSGAAGLNPYVKAGLGFEYLLTDRLGLDLNASSSYMLNDRFDDVEQGRFNDYFWVGKLGINYYFGGNR